MTGIKFGRKWSILWKYVCPISIALVFFTALISDAIKPPHDGNDHAFPAWALTIGWIISLGPCLIGTVTGLWIKHELPFSYRKHGAGTTVKDPPTTYGTAN